MLIPRFLCDLSEKDYNIDRRKYRGEEKMAYIEMKHCYKRYTSGETEILANQDVSFEIEQGELVIILGASGAGKSTVLKGWTRMTKVRF